MSEPTTAASHTGLVIIDDKALDLAIRLYEMANFRPWDKEGALYRYYNHPGTHRTVKEMAFMLMEDWEMKE